MARLSRREFLLRCAGSLAALAATPFAGGACAAASLASPLARLLFDAGFDLAPDAAVAAGSSTVTAAGARFWRLAGAGGRALAAFPGSVLTYEGAGNVDPQRGSLVLWVKILYGFDVSTSH